MAVLNSIIGGSVVGGGGGVCVGGSKFNSTSALASPRPRDCVDQLKWHQPTPTAHPCRPSMPPLTGATPAADVPITGRGEAGVDAERLYGNTLTFLLDLPLHLLLLLVVLHLSPPLVVLLVLVLEFSLFSFSLSPRPPLTLPDRPSARMPGSSWGRGGCGSRRRREGGRHQPGG